MSGISRNLNGPYARGVPNPYTVHVHPYPTRYHGGVYTRPVFGTPYVRRPLTVFKPDDFYDYYGVSGLGNVGSFGSNSLGYGSVGSNSLGLGATGQPIYWMASKTNSKVSTLQAGANKVLIANGYLPLKVTGKLEGTTCGALAWLVMNHKEELLSQVPTDLLTEAMRTCAAATKQGAKVYAPQKNPKPAISFESPAVIASPTTATPVPEAPTPIHAPSSPAPVLPKIEEPGPPVNPVKEITLEIPEMEIAEVAPRREAKSSNLGIILGLLAVGGGAYYFMRKKK